MDVSLYVAPELSGLLEDKSVDFGAAFITTLQNVISSHIFRGATQLSVSTASSFQVRPSMGPTDLWFVGALYIKKVLDDYFAAFVMGRFDRGEAKDFLTMERQSKEIYTRGFVNADQIIDQVVYNTRSDELKCWSLTCDKSDLDKPI